MILQILLFMLLHQAKCYTVLNDKTNHTTGPVEFVLLDQAHPCIRTCIKGGPPMVCHYKFHVEWYQTMSKACYDCPFNPEDCKRKHCIAGDGFERPVISINRQLPGPTVEVCLGDQVVVDVENGLMGDTTSIHWHGFHQKNSPFMDGVPMITQCPITPGTTFRYKFIASNAGTHFWHSHTDVQRGDGAFGPFIVRVPLEENPHKDLYDFDLIDHVMVIHDWGRETSVSKFVLHHHSTGDNKPATLLVNGLGRLKKYNNDTHSEVYSPTARFIVKQGYRYRFRVINAEFLNCPIEMSVDGHNLTILASDGNFIEPVEAASLVTYAGERFDFILNADQSQGLYWIRFKGLLDCGKQFTSAFQTAVLQYDGESDTDYPEGEVTYDNAHKEGLQVNALNVGSGQNGTLLIPDLVSLEPMYKSLKDQPDVKYFVSYDFYEKDHPLYHDPELYPYKNVTNTRAKRPTPQLNHISLKTPSFPLLTQRDQVNSKMFCNETNVKNCDSDFCECLHVVEIKLGSVIEMILIDKGFAYYANHPFHLHGHSFHVVAMDRLGEHVTLQEVEELDTKGLIQRNLVNPPIKDTVTVPDGGYTIIRFIASNPGYWLFHCHIDFHAAMGMAIIFKFGEHEQMVPTPRGFPTCGNYFGDINPVNDEIVENIFVSSSAVYLQFNFVVYMLGVVVVIAMRHFR